MKRTTVGKSKSFQMRRSNSKAGSGGKHRDTTSVDRRIVASYDDIIDHSSSSHLRLDDSDSDSNDHGGSGRLLPVEPDDSENSRYEELSRWAASISLANLMFTRSNSFQTFKAPPRTQSKFKPSYLLQRRKEGLVQHSHVPPSLLPVQTSRRHSILALLVLLTACYLLLKLKMTNWDPPSSSLGTSCALPTTYYYINLTEHRPLQMVVKMLAMHAFAYHQQPRPSKFAGVCGYPTYQQESQRQAVQLLVQMGLQDILQFFVCPPIEAILRRDVHYVVLDEPDLPTGTDFFSPAWQAAIAAQTKPTHRDPTDLWRQVLALGQSLKEDEHRTRRLRGVDQMVVSRNR